jgi:uncharacterized membrane protein YkvA (DUF1232 family)
VPASSERCGARGQRLMNVDSSWLSKVRWLVVATAVLCAAVVQPVQALPVAPFELPAAQLGLCVSAAAPGVLGRVHRMVSRGEHTLRRLASLVISGLSTWFWVLLSAAAFLVVAAVASATDVRMFAWGPQSSQVLARDLVHGVRMFFRILRDPRTPYLPRAVLALALVYWLLPVDLLGDGMPVVGMLDDLLIAVVAAKLFIHMCPDAVVAAHAAALRAHA